MGGGIEQVLALRELELPSLTSARESRRRTTIA
jgi:hypothetical protein